MRAALLLLAVLGQAQTIADRYRPLTPQTPVSNDPRRVPRAPGPEGPDGWLVLRGGRVFDGTGAAARPATLVIERNRVRAVQDPGAAATWPANARVLDVTGKTVLPGLVDLHTHITYVDPAPDPRTGSSMARAIERLRYYIETGITSIRDVASDGEVPFLLKQWVQDNRISGPRVFAAGQLITGTGGHGAEGLRRGSNLEDAIREAEGPDDWRKAVREQFKKGADVIKIASHFSKDEVRAAVEEAHALGVRVTCDCENFYIEWAVEAGVDSIEHPLPRTDRAIAEMARKGVASVPTLVPYEIIFDESGGYFGSTSRRFTFSKEANVEMLRRLKRGGVKLGVGTDLVMGWYKYLPEPYITELKRFVEAGFTIPEALTAATKTSAEILDMGHLVGTLEPGKLADVLVVTGRPDANLDDLANVDLVIRDGRVVVENGRATLPRHETKPRKKL